MSVASPLPKSERGAFPSDESLTNQAFSRAAGALLIAGNSIRLLKDAEENYPAWLEAIDTAKERVHFESYIIHEDKTGRMFADALIAKAKEGIPVRLIYDWLGCLGTASRAFWDQLREGGVEVRCYNPARWDSPFGWLSRDHRKTLCVDGRIGFVSGLCVGRMWVGDREKDVNPWRDTGVELCGPSVSELDRAFASVWAMTGEPIPEDELADSEPIEPQGEVALRIVGGFPGTGGMFRVDQLIAELAKKRLWLTDAYYAGMTSYVHALRSAAQDGVDVRLLVPKATDAPLLKPLSRAGYRVLLEAGVRVFEWNGTMLHAKTAVADGRWARVGSTNLNIASWFGNCEMDVVIEDNSFAKSMEEMFLANLQNATEIVLNAKRKVSAPNQPRRKKTALKRRGGSSGRAAAGAVRIANVVSAAFTNRRVIEPVEARITVGGGVLLVILAVLFAFYPRVIAYPVVLLSLWIAIALFYQGWKLHRSKAKR
ncbi:phospholipase D-like domain-containing protein [Akkermansiaceae bacterium]|nr:phospholipase D-like domain-containing protein [Akkermansiaceae bacterium]